MAFVRGSRNPAEDPAQATARMRAPELCVVVLVERGAVSAWLRRRIRNLQSAKPETRLSNPSRAGIEDAGTGAAGVAPATVNEITPNVIVVYPKG